MSIQIAAFSIYVSLLACPISYTYPSIKASRPHPSPPELFGALEGGLGRDYMHPNHSPYTPENSQLSSNGLPTTGGRSQQHTAIRVIQCVEDLRLDWVKVVKLVQLLKV